MTIVRLCDKDRHSQHRRSETERERGVPETTSVGPTTGNERKGARAGRLDLFHTYRPL